MHADNTERITHDEAMVERNESGKPRKVTGIINDFIGLNSLLNRSIS